MDRVPLVTALFHPRAHPRADPRLRRGTRTALLTPLVATIVMLAGCPRGIHTAPPDPPGLDDSATDTETDGSDDSGTPGDSEDSTTGPPAGMDPIRLVTRLSLDLRGIRPSDEDYARVKADPAAVDALLDDYLVDGHFEERLVKLYGERFQTLTESYDLRANDYGLDDDPGFTLALGEAPVRVLAHIAAEDLPYTEIVTGDWTMANEILGEIWPLDYTGTGWKVAHYTDGRPDVGLLAVNSLWWRFGSTESNANRKRANAVTRILTCNDYLERPIDFDRSFDLSDADAVADALTTNKSCVACHATLDPIASYLYGFWYGQGTSPADAVEYHPEREALWISYTNVPPAWYGVPGYSLGDLGDQIAADPRIATCAVETAWELFLRRDTMVEDLESLTAHREAFLAGGLTLRSLYRSVLSDAAYRAADSSDPRFVPTKWTPPDVLASQVEDLTGFRWTSDEYDMLLTDTYGLRNLAGGADGFIVTKGSSSPNATAILVQQRLAELAATYAVQTERRKDPSARRLLTGIDFTETVAGDPDVIRAQVQLLFLRVLGRDLATDDADIDATLALWSEIHDATDDIEDAWSGVMIYLFRDPDFVLY